MMVCSKWSITKACKFEELKNSFNFSVNICKYVSKNGIKSTIYFFITTKQAQESDKKYSFEVFAVLCHFYFGL